MIRPAQYWLGISFPKSKIVPTSRGPARSQDVSLDKALWALATTVLYTGSDEQRGATMKRLRQKLYLAWVLALVSVAFLAGTASAQSSDVLGEVQFEGKTNVEKTSGVWVDEQYVGYLKELRGSKKVLLLPGEHTISVRQNGYKDYTQKIVVQPGQTQIIHVAMNKAVTGPMPPDAELATIKIDVNPSRAAVFLDGRFVGHVGEFQGVGKALQVVPGPHQIRVALPGYDTFRTDINPLPKQKVEVKTELVKSAIPVAEPLLKGEKKGASEAHDATSPPH